MASIGEQLGQLMMVGFTGLKPGDFGVEQIRTLISEGKIGGVILMGHNIQSAQQVRELNTYLQSAAAQSGRPPIFIGIDQEGGKVSRLANLGLSFPSAEALAAAGPEAARAQYTRMAQELKSLGFNVNFGPVVDMHVKGNPIIAKYGRSYGTDPETVAKFAQIFMEAHMENGIIPVLKHFPGHGRSTNDSHLRSTTVPDSLPGTMRDLGPYMSLLPSAPAIMTGHIINPTISKDNLPASLSLNAIQGFLRANMGYTGAIFSDDLKMGGAQGYGHAPTMALRAGNNILLNTDGGSVSRHRDRIMRAVLHDPILAESVTESHERIMRLKSDFLQSPRPGYTRMARVDHRSAMTAPTGAEGGTAATIVPLARAVSGAPSAPPGP